MVDDFGELGAKAGEVGAGELAFEDGELEVVAPGAHGLEDAAEAFVVGDVVADEEGVAHRVHCARQKLDERSAGSTGKFRAARPEAHAVSQWQSYHQASIAGEQCVAF